MRVPSAPALAVGLFLLALVVWALAKGVPFLDTQAQAVYATPTGQPAAQISLPGKGGHLCTTGIEYGPQARYVEITTRSKYPLGPIGLEVRAPGYRADTTLPARGPQNGVLIAKIAPATREVGGGTLCVVNHGRHRVIVFGAPPGRGTSAASTTTLNGKPSPTQVSITLLTSPSASLGSRLGAIFDHAAAFRPVTGWEVWVLALLVGIGVPIAIAVALASAAAEDELPRPD
ncbi:MAG TPA: hypothetical protein VGM33_06930 [Baekduia sp.]